MTTNEKLFIDSISHEPEYMPDSKIFWTNGSVCVIASDYFRGCKHVLDIGSGIGKFSILAGMNNTDTKFTGVEIQPKFHSVANKIKNQFKLNNVDFILQDFNNVDTSPYDGFYIFNPFPMATRLHDHDTSLNTFLGLLNSMKEGTKLVMNCRFCAIPKDTFKHKGCIEGTDYYIKVLSYKQFYDNTLEDWRQDHPNSSTPSNTLIGTWYDEYLSKK